MRHSRGFTLVEVMTAMAVYGIFLSMLGATFYALLTFGTRSQQVLVAREHGRRVIEYVDRRIRSAGLGLHELKSSEEVRGAMNRLTTDKETPNGPLYQSNPLRLPVAVLWNDKDSLENSDFNVKPKISNDIQCGNILTILYAERETTTWETVGGKDYAVSLTIIPYITSGDDTIKLNTLSVSKDEKISLIFLAHNDYFNQYDKTFARSERAASSVAWDIKNWAVLRASGIPVRVIKDKDNNDKVYIQSSFHSDHPIKEFDICAGDELLYLNCERIFAEKDNEDRFRNLKVQKLSNKWGDQDPLESGILEIYAELDIRTNILTLWVLSTGGKDTVIHERSTLKDWPSTARWQDDKYKYDVLYVSRASWKLNNLCEGFDWSK